MWSPTVPKKPKAAEKSPKATDKKPKVVIEKAKVPKKEAVEKAEVPKKEADRKDTETNKTPTPNLSSLIKNFRHILSLILN